MAAGLAVLLACGLARAQWSEDFDSYDPGSTISGQGEWESWDNAPGVDAEVVDEQAYSEPNSLRLRTDSDMVVIYRGLDAGVWKARAMVYIPGDHTGETWYILLNTYNHGGPHDWSTQVVFTTGRVNSGGGSSFAGGGSLPWIVDEWVELEVDIDLEANVQTIRYGGELLDETPWQVSGIAEIQAIDLFSNGGSAAYFDDVSFTPVETGPRAVRTVSIAGDCPDPDPVAVTVRQPLADGADPSETVTVTETVRGDLGAAQVSAAQGGVVEDILPTPLTGEGFISSWLLLGPFTGHTGGDNPGCPEMGRDFLTDGVDPESDVYPEAGQTIATDFGGLAASTGIVGPQENNPGGVPTWNAHHDPNDTIDFNADYYRGNYDNVMMYAFAYVQAAEDVAVDLCVGSDDSIQVLIDGVEAWCNSIPRGVGAANECQDTVPYGTLRRGEHTVMVKVFEGGGGHGFRFGFKASGSSDPAPGITVCLTPDADPCSFAPVGATITWSVTRGQLADGVSYTVDVDGGTLGLRGNVAGLRTLGETSVKLCSTQTDLQGRLLGDAWLVIGPFPNANDGCNGTGNMLGNHVAPTEIGCHFPAEGEEMPFDLADPDQASTGYVGPTGPGGLPLVAPFADGTDDGDLDLDAHYGDRSDVMAWLITYVRYTGEPGTVTACLGSDDGGQVWFNDTLAINDPACRGRGDCDVQATVAVEPGVYRIAVGIWENDGGWGARFSLRDPTTGAPILDDGGSDWEFLGRRLPPAEEFPGGRLPCTGPGPGPRFIRGDGNADGRVDITDGIFVLNFLFLGGTAPPCTDAADYDDDAALNITDGIYLLNFLFLGGSALPPPTGESPGDCGEDATEDELDCASFPPCAGP